MGDPHFLTQGESESTEYRSRVRHKSHEAANTVTSILHRTVDYASSLHVVSGAYCTKKLKRVRSISNQEIQRNVAPNGSKKKHDRQQRQVRGCANTACTVKQSAVSNNHHTVRQNLSRIVLLAHKVYSWFVLKKNPILIKLKKSRTIQSMCQ